MFNETYKKTQKQKSKIKNKKQTKRERERETGREKRTRVCSLSDGQISGITQAMLKPTKVGHAVEANTQFLYTNETRCNTSLCRRKWCGKASSNENNYKIGRKKKKNKTERGRVIVLVCCAQSTLKNYIKADREEKIMMCK